MRKKQTAAEAARIEMVADQLRVRYCAQLGVEHYPKWDDIRNEKTKKYWREQAKLHMLKTGETT
jgi:hypothetical protein